MKSSVIKVDGEDIKIEISSHANDRCEEFGITEYEVYALVLKLGERLLELKNNEEFSVIDKEMGNAVVCSIEAIDGELFINVITVISNDHIYITRGTRIFNINNVNVYKNSRSGD